jgi:sortase A
MVLTIPRLGLRRAVPLGADSQNLRRYGVGHISWTFLPGGPGVVGIAGHRTTYGAPFLRLNALRPGDIIHLDYRGRRFTYAVTRSEVVTPDRVDILDGSHAQGIALVACTPVYSAAYRLVVLGAPASVTPEP